MTAAVLRFEDSAEYERFMGRWTRAVARVFLDWLAVAPGASWLDVGCGTGVLAETVLHLCAPASVHAVDVEPAQLAAAARGPAGAHVHFATGDARQLPFADAAFDAVASALLLNFVAERALALAEMRRVACPGGLIAAYVWDFAEELSPSGPLRKAMRRFGAEAPAVPGTESSGLQALQALFEATGLDIIETRTIDVCLSYENLEDFWQAQTPAYAPHTRIIAAMTDSDRASLMRAVAHSLPVGPSGTIQYCARANAIKSRVPPLT
ncbi:MAG: class I SAM-dependent methyltransferase, partial [Variovorax sp.]